MDEDKLHLEDVMNEAINTDIQVITKEVVNHVNNFIAKYHCNHRTVMYAIIMSLIEVLIDNEEGENSNV